LPVYKYYLLAAELYFSGFCSVSILSGNNLLPIVMLKQLITKPYIVASILVLEIMQDNQVKPTITIADQAPIIDYFFQNKPKVKGAKRQTKIRLRQASTNPAISVSSKAK
jgi:hypothetical protein